MAELLMLLEEWESARQAMIEELARLRSRPVPDSSGATLCPPGEDVRAADVAPVLSRHCPVPARETRGSDG